jgi:hypothetical protein
MVTTLLLKMEEQKLIKVIVLSKFIRKSQGLVNDFLWCQSLPKSPGIKWLAGQLSTIFLE